MASKINGNDSFGNIQRFSVYEMLNTHIFVIVK